MPTDSYKLGPGTLTLTAGVDVMELNVQTTNARIEPAENVTEGEDLNLLDGSTLAGDDDVSFSYVLAGTMVQDLNDTGVTAWTWDHKGETVTFDFVPVTTRVASVTGDCVVVPVQIGGDVKVRNTADFSFRVVGDPVFTPEDTTP